MIQQFFIFNENEILGFLIKRTENQLKGSEERELVRRLVDFSCQNAIEGNLFQKYICYYLIFEENAFNLTAESGAYDLRHLKEVVKQDTALLYRLFTASEGMEKEPLKTLSDYRLGYQPSVIGNAVERLYVRLKNCKEEGAFLDTLTDYYQRYGAGMYSVYKAFRLDTAGKLVPITHTSDKRLCDIVGYEYQKQRIYDNTKAFIDGQKANNVLLYGESGTGKSTTIKAILNEFWDQGLRIIELYKDQLYKIKDIIHTHAQRNYKFIIYMDDLSFEEHETEYKHLKAIIEGSLEEKTGNILIYATSNRRHLIKEVFADRNENNDEVHVSDTYEEKLSLASRFGLSIVYLTPAKQQYIDIVLFLAKKHNINMDEETLTQKAIQFELRKGGFSGRVAEQFINSLSDYKEESVTNP